MSSLTRPAIVRGKTRKHLEEMVREAQKHYEGMDRDGRNHFKVRVRGKKGPLCATVYSDGDTYIDLVCHFEDGTNESLTGSEDIATLTGMLLDGTLIEGMDSICITNQ